MADERLVLLGCVSSKLAHPAPARDLYVSDLWRKRRAYAESTGVPWAILSAEYGLLEPDEVIEPYDRHLARQSQAFKDEWVATTSEAVLRKCRQLAVSTVEAHAGKAYLETGLIETLNRGGIRVYWPLRVLRIGEQLQWYSARSSHASAPAVKTPDGDPPSDLFQRIEDLEAELADLKRQVQGARVYSRPAAAEGEGLSLDRKREIAQRILAYGKVASPDYSNPDAPVFTPVLEADNLIRTDPFAFLLGVIFDQGITAERAWEGPWLLKQRLGYLDPALLARSPVEVQRAVSQPPSLHRYIQNVPSWIVQAGEKVSQEYEGDASAIWSDNPSVQELRARLEAFKGIGVKKSAMAIEMLERDFGVPIQGMNHSDVAYDVHLRRVFIRTGLAERDEIGHMTEIARQIHPSRPGELDLPTWRIGREWCHPGVPDCPECVLDDVCDHRIEQGRSVKGA